MACSSGKFTQNIFPMKVRDHFIRLTCGLYINSPCQIWWVIKIDNKWAVELRFWNQIAVGSQIIMYLGSVRMLGMDASLLVHLMGPHLARTQKGERKVAWCFIQSLLSNQSYLQAPEQWGWGQAYNFWSKCLCVFWASFARQLPQ